MLAVFKNVLTPSNVEFLAKGMGLTLMLSVLVVIVSILFGTILALLRTYEKRFFGKLAGFYIEMFRNTPLLLWILVCCFMIPYGTIVIRGGLALTLYTSAVIAEIVRGGLNSIAEGQFEAATSQGFTLIQTLMYIVLPQCFKSIIPSLLSQVITTVKDTSFLQVVAIPEYTRSGFVVMGRYTNTSEVFMIFAILAVGYFVICFSLSCVVRGYQKRTEMAQ
ncbi:amino acid ABC transporter permease [Acetobacterium woodii]|uniref:Glutamine ABC transport system permease protein GlnP5 n=1 Tax=Acetobacterium woodii (strain ATCC 29683 / DSM 1030 / JCM 2381 / KCTC 1655 / WB1) TaxID=931626 RepID=H6LJG4_ACEWD|nr:amino acid ABC transporter permease [Acetobacterium woodii]AFA49892.1 glutamine ABC transport system permease protein GlnP5 [Acetobacterium woodii DSM 1030]